MAANFRQLTGNRRQRTTTRCPVTATRPQQTPNCRQVFQYLAFSAFVKTVRKHERILKQDKEFCSQVLTALVRMDLPALDAMADRTHDGDGGVRQQVAEVVEIMRALSSPQAAEASTDCRSESHFTTQHQQRGRGCLPRCWSRGTGIRWGVSPAAQMGCLRNRSGSPSGADQP